MNPVKSLIDVIYKENFALSVQVKLTFPSCEHSSFHLRREQKNVMETVTLGFTYTVHCTWNQLAQLKHGDIMKSMAQ